MDKSTAAADHDETLVEQTKQGSLEAFHALFLHYYDPLCSYSEVYTADFSLSEIIVQDIFAKIWNRKDVISYNTSFQSYLYRTTQSESLKAVSSTQACKNYARFYPDLASQSEAQILESVEKEQKLVDALFALPEKELKIFLANRISNKSIDVIADAHQTTPERIEETLGNSLYRLNGFLKNYIL